MHAKVLEPTLATLRVHYCTPQQPSSTLSIIHYHTNSYYMGATNVPLVNKG